VHWWHFTTVKDDVSLSITTIWCAEPARYTYPFPGLQVQGAKALVGLRRLKARLSGRPWNAKSACSGV
jgi:hypothetical protein